MHLTSPGAGYSEPNFEEVMALGEQSGMEKVPFFLMRDLANLASGGDVDASPPEAMKRYGVPGLFYQKLLSDLGPAISKVPGRTPLYKAFNLFKIAMQMAPQAMLKIMSFGDNEDDGKKIGEDEEQDRPEEDGGDDADYENTTDIDELDIDDEIWKSISRQLDISELMHSYRRVPFVQDPEGEEVRVRPLENLDELPKLVEEEWFDIGTPYFRYRVFAQEAFIRERGFREDQKQLVYLLVDSSGSMTDGNPSRMHKAAGVIYNRLKAVVEGKAVVYLRFFGEGLRGDKEIYIDTPALSKRFLTKVKEEGVHCGGGTDIPRSLKSAVKRCLDIHENHKDLILPELILVTDGQDNVHDLSPAWLTQHQMKLHYFEMIQHGHVFNEAIAKVAKDTGGVIASL